MGDWVDPENLWVRRGVVVVVVVIVVVVVVVVVVVAAAAAAAVFIEREVTRLVQCSVNMYNTSLPRGSHTTSTINIRLRRRR